VLFDELQQEAGVEIGVAVVRIPDIGAFAKERVGFFEQQYGTTLLGCREYAVEVLLRLTDADTPNATNAVVATGAWEVACRFINSR
jgi:hypothetical protein